MAARAVDRRRAGHVARTGGAAGAAGGCGQPAVFPTSTTTEERIAAALPDDLFVSLSSRVLPEIREYERGMATWLNAWVGPRCAATCSAWVLDFRHIGVRDAELGDTVAEGQAADNAVRMLFEAGRRLDGRPPRVPGIRQERLLTFDMGVPTDVALIDGGESHA